MREVPDEEDDDRRRADECGEGRGREAQLCAARNPARSFAIPGTAASVCARCTESSDAFTNARSGGGVRRGGAES
jgi:hypothetical protein